VFDRRKKKWNELTRGQQRMILAGAAVQLVLQVATLWDVRRRSADELRGSKRWWTAAAFVNIIGPIAYFAVGRRCGGRKHLE
jgi:Phospholipase_D-nuclease N-terminal